MNRYNRGELLGSGTYAKVYKGYDLLKERVVALKMIQINEKEGMPSTALREISILKSVSHENIVKILDIIHTKEYLCIVFEFMDYELMDYLDKHGNVSNMIQQLLNGLMYIHSHCIVHRDLKPSNILVSKSGELRIADFGLARAINLMDFSYSSEVVTLWYRAPELLLGCTDYKFEIDIWSVGCIIYEMITGRPLLPGNSKQNQLQLCKQLNLNHMSSQLTDHWKIPKFLIDIICRCLESTPSKRIRIEEILEIYEKNQR